VFFDAVGLPYEYEKEGFVLNDGTNLICPASPVVFCPFHMRLLFESMVEAQK
jgi:hypothetical protein